MHPSSPATSVPQPLLDFLNQVFEVEKKLSRIDQPNSIDRNVRKMREAFEDGLLGEYGLVYQNPMGEPYNETRTDCEASIAGDSLEGLVITEVIKPVIYLKHRGHTQLVQKAVVVVEGPAATTDSAPSPFTNSND